jgi:GxxExxY protein
MTLCRPSSLPFAPLTELIIEGFHDCVHELGCGFGEAVCQRAFKIVLSDKGLLVESGLELDVQFRGQEIGKFTTDLVVERLVIVEVKATARIEDVGRAQLLNYLKCAGGGVGLLANSACGRRSSGSSWAIR